MRPYTILSCAVSLDGYLDDTSDRRLILSNTADLDRVDAVRADSDAILVGATTIRRDDPSSDPRISPPPRPPGPVAPAGDIRVILPGPPSRHAKAGRVRPL